MTSPTRPSVPAHWLALAGWLALLAAAGALGAVASVDAAAFYAKLQRPSWAPPAAAFGPVWTLLYAMMALAAWLVWREKDAPGRAAALGLFVAQLAINVSWSWLFFAWHRGALAFADILLLDVLVVATIAAFARVRPLAAWLLVPYLAWIGFATALCYRVWQDNPGSLG
jgi:tryptophan-rich sensory protein